MVLTLYLKTKVQRTALIHDVQRISYTKQLTQRGGQIFSIECF